MRVQEGNNSVFISHEPFCANLAPDVVNTLALSKHFKPEVWVPSSIDSSTIRHENLEVTKRYKLGAPNSVGFALIETRDSNQIAKEEVYFEATLVEREVTYWIECSWASRVLSEVEQYHSEKLQKQIQEERHTGPIKKVAFIFAMEAEAAPFIKSLQLTKDKKANPSIPTNSFSGTVGGIEVIVSLNGEDARRRVDRVGTEPAVLNTYITAQSFKPDLIVNAGTAGGFIKRNAQIGDIYLSDGPVVYHDHRIPIPGFEAYGKGMYPSLPLVNLFEELDAKRGRISTGNSLDATSKDLEIISEESANVKDMEAAAIAQVAGDQNIAFLAVKAITDLVDAEFVETAESFQENLQYASEKLQQALLMLVDSLESGRNLEDL